MAFLHKNNVIISVYSTYNWCCRCKRSSGGYRMCIGHYIKDHFKEHYNDGSAHVCLSWVCQQLYLWWVMLTNNSWKKNKKPVQSSELHKSLMQLIPESEGESLYLGSTWRPEYRGVEPNPDHKNTAETSRGSDKILSRSNATDFWWTQQLLTPGVKLFHGHPEPRTF